MSGGDDLLVWVGDLDNYVNIDAINRANQREEEEAALRQELREIGELRLLDGKATSAKDLFDRNIAPSEWADYTKVRFTYARGEPLANAGEWHHAARSEEGVRNGRSWPGSGRLSTFQR